MKSMKLIKTELTTLDYYAFYCLMAANENIVPITYKQFCKEWKSRGH